MARKPKPATKVTSDKTPRSHITDRAGTKIAKVSRAVTRSNDTVPGPSTNPATNLIVSDLILRSIGRLARHSVEKGLLGRRYGKDVAKLAVENRSLIETLAVFGATRLATRSVPGAALVAGSLLAKTLYDRRRSRKAAQRSGDRAVTKQARRGKRG